jgi:hypothetical protein
MGLENAVRNRTSLVLRDSAQTLCVTISNDTVGHGPNSLTRREHHRFLPLYIGLTERKMRCALSGLKYFGPLAFALTLAMLSDFQRLPGHTQ